MTYQDIGLDVLDDEGPDVIFSSRVIECICSNGLVLCGRFVQRRKQIGVTIKPDYVEHVPVRVCVRVERVARTRAKNSHFYNTYPSTSPPPRHEASDRVPEGVETSVEDCIYIIKDLRRRVD